MSDRTDKTRITVPPGFRELLGALCREILRHQPKNIIDFAADYFEQKLRARDGAHPLLRPYYAWEKIRQAIDSGLITAEVECMAAVKIQSVYRGHRARVRVKQLRIERGLTSSSIPGAVCDDLEGADSVRTGFHFLAPSENGYSPWSKYVSMEEHFFKALQEPYGNYDEENYLAKANSAFVPDRNERSSDSEEDSSSSNVSPPASPKFSKATLRSPGVPLYLRRGFRTARSMPSSLVHRRAARQKKSNSIRQEELDEGGGVGDWGKMRNLCPLRIYLLDNTQQLLPLDVIRQCNDGVVLAMMPPHLSDAIQPPREYIVAPVFPTDQPKVPTKGQIQNAAEKAAHDQENGTTRPTSTSSSAANPASPPNDVVSILSNSPATTISEYISNMLKGNTVSNTSQTRQRSYASLRNTGSATLGQSDSSDDEVLFSEHPPKPPPNTPVGSISDAHSALRIEVLPSDVTLPRSQTSLLIPPPPPNTPVASLSDASHSFSKESKTQLMDEDEEDGHAGPKQSSPLEGNGADMSKLNKVKTSGSKRNLEQRDEEVFNVTSDEWMTERMEKRQKRLQLENQWLQESLKKQQQEIDKEGDQWIQLGHLQQQQYLQSVQDWPAATPAQDGWQQQQCQCASCQNARHQQMRSDMQQQYDQQHNQWSDVYAQQQNATETAWQQPQPRMNDLWIWQQKAMQEQQQQQQAGAQREQTYAEQLQQQRRVTPGLWQQPVTTEWNDPKLLRYHQQQRYQQPQQFVPAYQQQAEDDVQQPIIEEPPQQPPQQPTIKGELLEVPLHQMSQQQMAELWLRQQDLQPATLTPHQLQAQQTQMQRQNLSVQDVSEVRRPVALEFSRMRQGGGNPYQRFRMRGRSSSEDPLLLPFMSITVPAWVTDISNSMMETMDLIGQVGIEILQEGINSEVMSDRLMDLATYVTEFIPWGAGASSTHTIPLPLRRIVANSPSTTPEISLSSVAHSSNSHTSSGRTMRQSRTALSMQASQTAGPAIMGNAEFSIRTGITPTAILPLTMLTPSGSLVTTFAQPPTSTTARGTPSPTSSTNSRSSSLGQPVPIMSLQASTPFQYKPQGALPSPVPLVTEASEISMPTKYHHHTPSQAAPHQQRTPVVVSPDSLEHLDPSSAFVSRQQARNGTTAGGIPLTKTASIPMPPVPGPPQPPDMTPGRSSHFQTRFG